MSPEVTNGLFAIGGAVIGAVVSGIFAWVLHHRTKERKELSIVLSPPKQLINVHDSIRDNIRIEIAGHEAQTASHMDYYVANTGNSVLEDVDIDIETIGNTEIFGGAIPESNFDGPVGKTADVHWEENGSFSIKSPFLNPGDEMSGYVLMANVPLDTRVRYRAPGVKLIVKKGREANRNQVFSDMVMEIVASNWVLDFYLKLVLPSYRERRRKDEL